ncbi:hypothetical protein I4100191B2_08610 [Clostridiales bacterium]
MELYQGGSQIGGLVGGNAAGDPKQDGFSLQHGELSFCVQISVYYTNFLPWCKEKRPEENGKGPGAYSSAPADKVRKCLTPGPCYTGDAQMGGGSP